MKNYLALLIFIIIHLTALNSYGQFAKKAPDSEDGEIWMMSDNMPTFPGGFEGLYKHIDKKSKCSARKADTKKVMVQFIIDSTGYIRKGSVKFVTLKYVNNEVINGYISEKCGKELISIFENLPQWTPGYVTEFDKNVAVRMAIPVAFK